MGILFTVTVIWSVLLHPEGSVTVTVYVVVVVGVAVGLATDVLDRPVAGDHVIVFPAVVVGLPPI